MIAHLRGKLIYKHPGQAIVEAGGVGYDVTISVPTFTALPSVGAEAALHIHTQVSEDQIALFGFLDREEKRLFERLITVSGVGPKLAIGILSGLSVERTVQAIRGHHEPPGGDFLAALIHLSDLLVRTRIPNGPADEGLAFVLEEDPAYREVFAEAADLDEERLTFGIDDELDHAVTFVKLVFQE